MYVLITCNCKPFYSQKQERSKRALCKQVSAGARRNIAGGKKLFSVNMFGCAVVNRAQFKGSGNLRRFLSRLTNFLQRAVSARKRHHLHISTAGCFKKKKVHVRTTPHPLYRAIFQWKRDICENRALQQTLCTLGCHFARRKCVFLLTVYASCLGIFRRGLGFFVYFLTSATSYLSFEVLLYIIDLKYIVLILVKIVV